MDEGSYGCMGLIAFGPRAETADSGAAMIMENMQREITRQSAELARLQAENKELREAAQAAMGVFYDYRIDSTEEIDKAYIAMRAALK